VPVEIGGGFGGKTVVFLEPIAALLARKSGRPVKMVMDRKAVFEGSAPAPGGRLVMKIGVRDDGRLAAATADVWFEAGAYPGWVVDTGVKSIFSCYDIPNTRVDGYDVLVNKPKSGAYRAPGAPQVTFATETLIDEICRARNWDPFEFRLKNAAREGTRRSDGPAFTKIGFVETLEAARSSDHWRTALEREGKRKRRRIRGRGVASGFVLHAGRESSVALNVGRDGTVAMTMGSVDMGGSRTSIAMQAAEVLGIPVRDVRPTVADTLGIGFTEISHGSRTTYATGAAAHSAAVRLIDELRGRAALLWGIDEENVNFSDGLFFAAPDPAIRLSFRELAARLGDTGGAASAVAAVDLQSPGGSVFGTHIADVEIDPETGKVRVIRYTAVQDAGTAIHPALVEGQMQGGVAQGIGWALNEGYFMEPDGTMANAGFTDYRMPTALDLPEIETIIVEVPNPRHPFGVRGAGEVPIVPPVAAIANAIYDALGVRMTHTPMNPTRILEAMGRIGVEPGP
jgi:CO/xanthine dehydrogenase Mo-binding subunit